MIDNLVGRGGSGSLTLLTTGHTRSTSTRSRSNTPVVPSFGDRLPWAASRRAAIGGGVLQQRLRSGCYRVAGSISGSLHRQANAPSRREVRSACIRRVSNTLGRADNTATWGPSFLHSCTARDRERTTPSLRDCGSSSDPDEPGWRYSVRRSEGILVFGNLTELLEPFHGFINPAVA